MAGRFFISGPEGADEFPSVRRMTIRVDQQEQVESQTFVNPRRRNLAASGTLGDEPAARARLIDRLRQLSPPPEAIEGRSELRVSDVL